MCILNISGYHDVKLKMTELLWEIQRTQKCGDPKFTAEYTDGGFISYVTIPVDKFGKTAEFMSDKKDSLFEATENVARKAIDCSTSTYKLNIVDYTSESLDKLSKKYMSIELSNTKLEESNRVLLQSLSIAQEENKRLCSEIEELKMQITSEDGLGFGRMKKLRMIKDERKDVLESVKTEKCPVSKKLSF